MITISSRKKQLYVVVKDRLDRIDNVYGSKELDGTLVLASKNDLDRLVNGNYVRTNEEGIFIGYLSDSYTPHSLYQVRRKSVITKEQYEHTIDLQGVAGIYYNCYILPGTTLHIRVYYQESDPNITYFEGYFWSIFPTWGTVGYMYGYANQWRVFPIYNHYNFPIAINVSIVTQSHNYNFIIRSIFEKFVYHSYWPDLVSVYPQDVDVLPAFDIENDRIVPVKLYDLYR